MNELIDGSEHEISYSVAASRGNHGSRDFTDPKEAAKAFHEIDANDRPHVSRITRGPEYAAGGAGQLIAQTAGRGEPSQAIEYWKYSGNQDPAFDAAYRELTGERAEAIDGREAKDLAERANVAIRERAEASYDDIEPDVAREWARFDLEDLRKLKTQERLDDAAVVIRDNMKNPEYKAEFERVDAEAAKAVELLAAQAGKRLAPEASQEATMTIDGVTPERLAAVNERDAEDARKALGVSRDENQVSEKFVADLDSRMEKAQLEERGWRNRDDIEDVMRDLEVLSAQNWHRAAELWDKYRPHDIDKPVFIDGDDVDEKKRGTMSRDDAEKSAPAREATDDDDRAGASGNKVYMTPEMIRKRFLQAENKFYFRDDENKLAFEDKGKRLATEHNDPEVARSMVELAEAKGWNSIKLKGTDEFKREVWLQASLKGMDIQGFQPRDVDHARLADLRKEKDRTADKGLNTIDQTPERARQIDHRASRSKTPAELSSPSSVVDEHRRTLSHQQRTAVDAIKTVMRGRGDSEKAVEMAANLATERFQTNRVYVGKVLEHGAAPYDNNPKNENSHYVKLQTDSGEKVVWGIDLKRAVGEGNAEVGDDVALAYQGRQQVTVKVKERDDQGKVVGESEIVTNRNTWDVRRLETMREEVKERMTEDARKADRQPIVRIFDRDAPRAEVRPEVVRETARQNERSRG